MNRQIKQDVATTRNWAIVVILLGLVVLLVYSIINAIGQVKTSRANLKQTRVEYDDLYQRSLSIEETVANFENDFGFEKYVRENFGVAKPGEKVIIVVDNRPEE